MQEAVDNRVGLQVIGVGFGRTGTSSLRAALERLGFGPCYHMWEVIYRVDRARMWHRIGLGERPNWNEVFAGYRATVDWPGAAFWRELVDAYPEAKIILTVRDPERWYESARNTIFRFPLRRHNAIQRWAFAILSKVNPAASEVPVMLDTVLWDRVFAGRAFDGRDGDRAAAVDTFTRHVEDVKAHVPAERLLVFDVAEGWAPLCEFLGVPVPEAPFPRLNETDEFNRMLADRRWVAVRPVALAGGAVLVVGGAGMAIAAAAGAGTAAVVGGGLTGIGLLAVVLAIVGGWAGRWRNRPVQVRQQGATP